VAAFIFSGYKSIFIKRAYNVYNGVIKVTLVIKVLHYRLLI